MSHDTRSKLVYMANQIATFFASQPSKEAAQGVATHINKFWEPRMRRQLFEILEEQDNGLDALVLEAAPLIRKPEAAANQLHQ
jgi:formate dehydrogenase subunit delta